MGKNILFFLTVFILTPCSGVVSAMAQSAPSLPGAAPAEGEGQFDDVLKKIEESNSGMPELPPTATPAAPAQVTTTVTTTTTATPPQTVLESPATPPVANGGDIAKVPALPANPKPSEDLFFDAEALGGPSRKPSAQQNSVVRQVNPQTEPASKFIVVKKNAEPGSRQAQLVAAQRAMMLGRYDSALSMYDALYAKNKKDPSILLGRAVALQKLKQDDAAMYAYEELLDINPNNADAQINMLGLMSEKYPAVAMQRLSDLQKRYPDNVAILAQLAVVQGNLGYYDDAVKYLGMAASLEPTNAVHYYNMAIIADRAGNKADAIRFYEKTLEIDAIYSGGSSVPRESVFDRLAQIR